MTQHTQTLAARVSAQDLETVARQGVARALAARQSVLTELTDDQTRQVAGAASITTVQKAQLVPGWWIYGKPGVTLSQTVINQGINQIPGNIVIPSQQTFR